MKYDPSLWNPKWSTLNKIKTAIAYALMITLITLHVTHCHAQPAMQFNQGYIKAETITIFNSPIKVSVDSCRIQIESLLFEIMRTEHRPDGTLLFYVEGGVIVYSETAPFGPTLVFKALNLQFCIWKNVVKAYEISLN